MGKCNDDLLVIPSFLKRKYTPKMAAKDQAEMERLKDVHPGALIVMPNHSFIDPRQAIRAEAKRDFGVRAEGGSKKPQKVQHPTTVAIKKHLGSLKGAARRKAVYAVARENGIDPTRWDHLNDGQAAMNMTNVIRGMYYKRDRTLYIGGVEVNVDYLDSVLGE